MLVDLLMISQFIGIKDTEGPSFSSKLLIILYFLV